MAERLEAQERQREADQLAHQQQMADMIAFLQSVGAQTGVALPATLLAPRQPSHVFTTPINTPVRKLNDTSKS